MNYDISYSASEMKTLLQQAKKGDIDTQYTLGRIYGVIGKNQNWRKSHRYLKKAADRGHMLAQKFCGYNYHKGEGVKINIKKAIHYYTLAAQQGDLLSLMALDEIPN